MDAVKIIKKKGEPGGLPVLTAFVSADAPGEVPASAISDSGKVLTVGEDGVPAWTESSGGGGYDPGEVDKPTIVLTPLELMTILGGTPTTKAAPFYDSTKFQPYMTVSVTTDPATAIILYATSYDDANKNSKTFITGSYVDTTDKNYFITAVLVDPDAKTFTLNASEL